MPAEAKKKVVKKATAKPHAVKPKVKKEVKEVKEIAEQKAIVFEAKIETKEAGSDDKKSQYYTAIGRRKQATAIVRLYKNGSGNVTVNGKTLKNFFSWEVWENTVIAPLKAVGQADKLDVIVIVRGGGLRGQADAIRHGISRALLMFNPVFRRGLKKIGFLTRDSRVKERKKYGLKKARRGPQWAKR